MKYFNLIILMLVFFNLSSQIKNEDQSKFLTFGIGPSFLGHTGNLGIHCNNNFLIIGNYERQYYLADAFDVGIGLRKYYGKQKHKLFIQPNLSYSTYKPWNWNTPPLPLGENEVKKTPKVSIIGGLELSITKNINVNFQLGYGYYSNLEFGRKIARTTLNYVIFKKKNQRVL
jgi:hypothetical protein